MTMQGPRVTLVRSDYVPEGTLTHGQIRIIRGSPWTPEILYDLLCYGEQQGLGQFRSGSYGRFQITAWEMKRFVDGDDSPAKKPKK